MDCISGKKNKSVLDEGRQKQVQVMTRLKDLQLWALMANNVKANENRMRLHQILTNPQAIEFWASQFGDLLRVKCDDFFLRFAFIDATYVPQKFKDFSLEEKKIFVDVCAKRQDEDRSGDITPIELELFFNDMTNDKFFVDKIHLLVAKEKYKRHFSLDKCQEYCNKLIDLMKENGIEIVEEINVDPEAVKTVAQALNLVPVNTEHLTETVLEESDGTQVGQTSGGKAHGFGIRTFKNGNKQIGYNNNGNMTGIGYYDQGKAGRYFGNFLLNKRCGLGQFQWQNSKQKYIGCWKGDKKDGLCIYEWQNDKGLMTWQAGYQKMDQRSGFGQTKWEQDTTSDYHEGYYENGTMQGQCQQKYKIGGQQDGFFLKGNRGGYGKQIFPDGAIAKGQWVDGKKDGYLEQFYAHGDIYKGYWQMEKRHGKGQQTWCSGDVYDGDWVQNIRTGTGKYAYANGTIQDGTFDNNIFLG